MGLLSSARAVRRSRALRRAEPLWKLVAPAFDAALRLVYGRRGIAVVLANGETVRLDPRCRTFVGASDSGSGETDPLFELLVDEVRVGDRFADVGANIGIYAIAAARRGAVVDAYEPHPVTAALLRHNVELNGLAESIAVHEVAVAASPAELRLSEAGAYKRESQIDPGGRYAVRGAPLTEPCDLLKIDVEGYELEVLRGAATILAGAGAPRAIFLELHPGKLAAAGRDPVAFRSLVAGYTLTQIATRGGSEHWVCRRTDEQQTSPGRRRPRG